MLLITTCCLWLTEKSIFDWFLVVFGHNSHFSGIHWNIKNTSFMLSRNRTSSNPLGHRGGRVGWLDKCACCLCFPINIVNKFLVWWMNSSSTILDCCWERWRLLLAETSLHLLEVLVRFGCTAEPGLMLSTAVQDGGAGVGRETWNSWMALRRAPNGDLNTGKHDGKEWC